MKGNKIGFAVAGNTSLLWQMAELGNLPIESHKLQAFVTEAVKPFLDHVVVYGVGGAHFYISQSDKGSLVFGGDLDWYKSYAQRGNLPMVQDVAEAHVCNGLPLLLKVSDGNRSEVRVRLVDADLSLEVSSKKHGL